MKTFQEFCEQASPFANKPEHPAKKFVRDVVGGITRRFTDRADNINNTLLNLRLAAGIHTDPKANYMQRDNATRKAKLKLRGINPENPDKMPIVQNNSEINYSLRQVAPPPPSHRGFDGKPTLGV